MNNLLTTIFPCVIRRERGIQLPTTDSSATNSHPSITEKTPHPHYHDEKIVLAPLTVEEASARIVSALFEARTAGSPLIAHIDDIAHQAGGWSHWLADKTRQAIEAALKAGKDMKPVFAAAYAKACEAAKVFEQFTADHPLATAVFVTVIAIGVLVILGPYVVELLGFGELGPIEGSWAAAWQSTYGGFVPKGSLFSYLQRLGMTWK